MSQAEVLYAPPDVCPTCQKGGDDDAGSRLYAPYHADFRTPDWIYARYRCPSGHGWGCGYSPDLLFTKEQLRDAIGESSGWEPPRGIDFPAPKPKRKVSKPSCKRCAFFEKGKTFDWGECRRYAPHMTTSSGKNDDPWMWPVVRGKAWCGEFKPKAKD